MSRVYSRAYIPGPSPSGTSGLSRDDAGFSIQRGTYKFWQGLGAVHLWEQFTQDEVVTLLGMDRTNFTPEAKWGTGDVAAPNISDVLLGRTPAPCCVQLAKQNGTSPPFSPRGSTFGFTANVSLIPSLRSGVALVNRKRADPLGKTIGRRVLQALTGAQTQAARTSLPRAAALNPHAGRSTSKAGNVWVEVQRSGRRLSTFKAPLQGTGRGCKQTLALAGPLGNLAHPLGNAVLGQRSVPHS